MKTLLKFSFVAFIVLFATTAFAQEWSKAQKEVWQVVEDSWAKLQAGDVDGAAANFHEKYLGWNEEMPLPMGKAKVIQMYKKLNEFVKVESYDLEPARIVVTDDGAVVYYYFSLYETMILGDKKEQKQYGGKNVEFYVKENGKWLLLGDLTIIEEEDDD